MIVLFVTAVNNFHCVNKLCKSTNTQLSKNFHYICYKHMMRAKSNEGMQVLDLDNKKDVIVDKIAEGINISTIEESIKNNDI